MAETCAEEGCSYDAVYVVPTRICEWHWHLWFTYGDESLALEDLRRYRARSEPDDLADDGSQRPITFLDRIGNDADRRFATDMGNETESTDCCDRGAGCRRSG